LLAAFNFLMDRYTGESAVTVGTPVSLRGPSPTTEMIGLFINALPLRSEIDHTAGFDRLLASTRDGFIAALEHKDLPFDDLVAALAPRRDARHNPFFQVMFVMETELAPSPVPDLDVGFRMFDTGTAKFDLTVFARLSGNGLRLSAEYNTELFEAETVETLLNAYGAVLAEVTASPQQPLAKIGLVPPASREAIVDGAWGPSVDLSGVAPLSDQILEQAARTPADQALIQGDRRVDYADLERASADLGAALAEAGHEGNDPVAIVLERSPDYPIALLAVMRAGGAYVPIDATAPPARMAQVIQELTAGCQGRRPLAICAAHDRARVTAAGAQAVTPGAAVSADASARGPTPPDLAYIIYTSGSTGRPKGVAITHANLAASTQARNAFYGGAPARFLLVSPFHFDSSVAGIYWTLAAGGSLILPAADNAADPRHLAATIAKEDVTHALLLPGLYSLLLDAAKPGQLDSLKTVIVAGEALSRELVESHCARLPATELVNEYGPTEGTVWTTATRCTPDGRTPSIGRPIANAGAYVVDSDLNPLVAGAAGELCIAGAGVAEGYYLQPKQTAERFLADPFRRSGRIYRSGDRVRRRADGNLEFLGRLDAQLKISGYRIEPAEIEAALVGLDGIDEAAVVARNTPGNRATTLVAWCTPNQDDQAGAEVAEALAGSLPDYMIPRSIRFCESLPRTATGKIDRHVLRARDIDLPAAVDRPHRKLTPTERRLAGLWRTLLGVEKLSAESHFFELGGHSLLGVTLMLEVDRAFDCALPLSVLFESPTLGGLARRIDGVEGISAPFEFLNPYQIGGSRLPLFIVQGDVREIARQLGPDQPIYLAYRGLDGVSTDELSVERYARLTLEEIRRVQPEGPYQIFGYSFGGQVALEMAKVLARDGERMAVLGLIDPPSTEEASYARLEARRLRARLQSVGGPLAQLGHLLQLAPQMTGKLLRRGWQRLRAVQLSRKGQPLPKELVMARDRAYYIRTSAGYRYERYEGDLLLIVPEGHAGSGEKTITAWQSLVEGRLTGHIIAGALDHEDLLLPPWQGKVAAVIGESLATAPRGADDAGDMPGDRSDEAARDEAQEVPG
jgi:amino acid adenylation domain-containing protein